MNTIKILLTFILLGAQMCINAQHIIPMPLHLASGSQYLSLNSETKIYYSDSLAQTAALQLRDHIRQVTQLNLKVVFSRFEGKGIYFQASDGAVALNSAASYYIRSDAQAMLIQANAASGYAHALQSLKQLITGTEIPMVKILDEPKYSWRGMHLDVSRHFFSVSFIKRFLDLMAFYKFNRFHWHLTDDQGWRIEIRAFPKLTQTGAWRSGSMLGSYTDKKFDTKTYGGFYTQNDIREIVAYAQALQITVVPEIEMPGHATALLAAYPELSCNQKPLEVAKGWGVFEDVICTRDTCFKVLQGILDEVCALFPGPYIHIGGDECPKTRWKSCKACQTRIAQEHLKSEHELQSYFIKRIEAYLKTKQKSIIGWDEILEGGLAPDATVMSWRGETGGIEAAKQKHDVIMSPGKPCYFDHYQEDPRFEPLAIGGYNSLQQVYCYNPLPGALPEAYNRFVLGSQGNVWTEYMADEKQVEYMILPRMTALSEVLWSGTKPENYYNYLKRLQSHFKIWDAWGLTYNKSIYHSNVKITPGPKPGSLSLNLEGDTALGKPAFKINATYQYYKKPIVLESDTSIQFGMLNFSNQPLDLFRRIHLNVNKASSSHIRFKTPPSEYYNTGGYFTLVDCIKGSKPRINSQWLGWLDEDMELELDLGAVKQVSTFEIGFLKEESSYIYLPKDISMWYSENGTDYMQVLKNQIVTQEAFKFKNSVINTRFIKLKARHTDPIAGSKTWLFCDEIQIQ